MRGSESEYSGSLLVTAFSLWPLKKMTEETQIGVEGTAPDPAVIAAAESPTVQESSENSQASVLGSDEAPQQPEEEKDPLEGLPSLEQIKQDAEKKVPYAIGLANVVEAYEGVKPLKALEPWKEVAELVGDPIQARTAYELVKSLRTPVEGNPNEFTTRPFLERVDQERPGSANQIFHDLLTYEVPDENGRVDTLVRHMYRSHGLDPDRVDDYRNIDTLRASGVVSAEDLARIPEQHREAFRSLSQVSQDSVLSLIKSGDPSYALEADEHLRNAQLALEARQYRQQQEEAQQKAAEQQQVEYQQQVAQAVEADMAAEVHDIHDSILNKSLGQFTFSSDATQDSLTKTQIMATLATLQNPAYRFVAENALKAVGVTLNGFDELANRWTQERVKYIAFKAAGQENTWDAREALSKATYARQQILARLNDYALKLAQASGERAAGAAAQQGSQLAAATSRYVPPGTAASQQGNTNPYMNNPYDPATQRQEWVKWYRDLDKANGLNGASMFSG